jgi:hypothetical protein
MPHRKLTVYSMLGAALVSGCATDVCACRPAPPTATVYGLVQTADGAAVEGALVQAYSAEGEGCASMGIDFGVLFSGSGGLVSGSLSGVQEQASVCVYVYARPPQERLEPDGSDTTLVVLDFATGEPQDSARVVLVLPAK